MFGFQASLAMVGFLLNLFHLISECCRSIIVNLENFILLIIKIAMKASNTNHPKVSDPSYKKGEEVSLRVYTVEDESRYIVVKNVPKLGLIHEL
jgi:midasin (ATPase involved in ribosome maturation)